MKVNNFKDIYSELELSNKVSSLKALSEDTGINYTFLSELRSGKKALTKDMIERINFYYKTEFELLREDYPLDNLKKDLKNEVKQVSSDNFMEVALISINAQAGYLNSISENDEGFMNEMETILVPKEFEKGYYLVIEVNGDSMDDGTSRAICSGDKLLCQELQKIHWNNRLHIRQYIFVIVGTDGIVCKQITNHDLDNGNITCHSWNPLFQDYTVNMKDIYQLFYVKKVVERRIKF